MTCLQKAFLYNGLDRQKFVLLALYATRPSLSALKIRAKAFRKTSKMTWNLHFKLNHDNVCNAISDNNLAVASVLWVEKTFCCN